MTTPNIHVQISERDATKNRIINTLKLFDHTLDQLHRIEEILNE